jgi:MFS transporter, SHS family, lactate transporter
VQGILIGCVAAFVFFITIIGPEYVSGFSMRYPLTLIRNHGAHFEKHKTAFEQGAADDDAGTKERRDSNLDSQVEKA